MFVVEHDDIALDEKWTFLKEYKDLDLQHGQPKWDRFFTYSFLDVRMKYTLTNQNIPSLFAANNV